jgi:hypothetical protein
MKGLYQMHQNQKQKFPELIKYLFIKSARNIKITEDKRT